jgi:hypothetical protein
MTQALQRIFLQGSTVRSYLDQLAPPCEACGRPMLATDRYTCRNCADDDGFAPPRVVTYVELHDALAQARSPVPNGKRYAPATPYARGPA